MNRKKAQSLYNSGYTVTEIGKILGKPHGTVNSWRKRDGWDNAPVIKRIEVNLDYRLCQLISKEDKSDKDYKEIDKLTALLPKLEKFKLYQVTGKQSDINPKIKERSKKAAAGRKKKKNFLSAEDINLLEQDFQSNLFSYQREWWEAEKSPFISIRNILKSRQIGATWYFAREALISAVTGGNNKIFLSASKNQAHVFKSYIMEWVEKITGVILKGDPITVQTEDEEIRPTLYFLGTNAKTAQSYHGDVYMDEYFWIHGFKIFNKVTSGMAMQAAYNKTYFSTPSAVSHEAHPFWTGEVKNKGRKEEDKIKIDLSHDNLRDGKMCADGQWKQIITVEDAIAKGCNLFNIEQLKLEYSDEEFKNLLMCHFMDDDESVFNLKNLLNCGVDIWEKWQDIKQFSSRPVGDRPVWIGYDPSRSRDDAALCVILPPQENSGVFRVIEVKKFNNYSFERQAGEIKKMCEKYNVAYIGIDATGIGLGVYELVEKFYPAVDKIIYSVEIKTKLILKTRQLIDAGMMKWDAGLTYIANAFLMIKRGIAGGKTTYFAERSKATGHSDIAFAIMNGMYKRDFTNLEVSSGAQPAGGLVIEC